MVFSVYIHCRPENLHMALFRSHDLFIYFIFKGVYLFVFSDCNNDFVETSKALEESIIGAGKFKKINNSNIV